MNHGQIPLKPQTFFLIYILLNVWTINEDIFVTKETTCPTPRLLNHQSKLKVLLETIRKSNEKLFTSFGLFVIQVVQHCV